VQFRWKQQSGALPEATRDSNTVRVASFFVAAGYWLLAVGYWLLAIGYWLTLCLKGTNISAQGEILGTSDR